MKYEIKGINLKLQYCYCGGGPVTVDNVSVTPSQISGHSQNPLKLKFYYFFKSSFTHKQNMLNMYS